MRLFARLFHRVQCRPITAIILRSAATRSPPGQRPLRRHHHVNFLSGVIPSEVDGPERSTDQIIRSFCNQTNHGRAVFRYRPRRPPEDAGPGRQTEGYYRERSRIASNNWRRPASVGRVPAELIGDCHLTRRWRRRSHYPRRCWR